LPLFQVFDKDGQNTFRWNMLPSLAFLTTGPPAAKHGKLTLDPLLLSLPPDVLEKIVQEATSGRGVPLLMVRKQVHNREFGDVKTDYAYLRLPDHSQFKADTNPFEDDYAFAEMLYGLMDLAGYTKDSTHPIFVHLDDQHTMPSFDDVDDDDDGYLTMVTFLDQVTRFDANGRLNPSSYFYNGSKTEMVFSVPPDFKSHIAIILTVEFNQ